MTHVFRRLRIRLRLNTIFDNMDLSNERIYCNVDGRRPLTTQ